MSRAKVHRDPVAVTSSGDILVNPAYVEICWKRVAQDVLPLVAHAPDCAIAMNGRHACSCMPNASALPEPLGDRQEPVVGGKDI